MKCVLRLTSPNCVALLSGVDDGMFGMWESQTREEVVWFLTVLRL